MVGYLLFQLVNSPYPYFLPLRFKATGQRKMTKARAKVVCQSYSTWLPVLITIYILKVYQNVLVKMAGTFAV